MLTRETSSFSVTKLRFLTFLKLYDGKGNKLVESFKFLLHKLQRFINMSIKVYLYHLQKTKRWNINPCSWGHLNFLSSLWPSPQVFQPFFWAWIACQLQKVQQHSEIKDKISRKILSLKLKVFNFNDFSGYVYSYYFCLLDISREIIKIENL